MAKTKKKTAKKGPSQYDWGTTEGQITKDLNEDLRDAWIKLRDFAAGLGKQRIYPSATAIMFARQICYFFVRPKKSFIEVWIFLPRKIEGLKANSTEGKKVKYANLFKLEHPDQVEEPLTDWIREAFEFAPELEGEEVIVANESTKSADKNDWREKVLTRLRKLIEAADPQVREERKWGGVPVWSHDGIICTGERYKDKIKMTFAKGAKLKDPKKLFNSSLDGNIRRAFDIFEKDKLDEAAFKALIKEAVALNVSGGKKKTARKSK